MCCSPTIRQETTVAGAEGAGGRKGGQGWRNEGGDGKGARLRHCGDPHSS